MCGCVWGVTVKSVCGFLCKPGSEEGGLVAFSKESCGLVLIFILN